MNPKWYLAELIIEFHVANETSSLVHVNWILVNANNPEEAYEKANRFGDQENTDYTNTDGNHVNVRFRGLRDLNRIHEELADGSEIAFEEYEDITETDMAQLISAKDKLAVFRSRSTD